MASIIQNQKRAFLASAHDDARRLTHSLANLSDAQRAAILAIIAAKTSTPVDLVLQADHGDAREIAFVLAGELRTGDDPNTYLLGSGCLFTVVPPPGEDKHE